MTLSITRGLEYADYAKMLHPVENEPKPILSQRGNLPLRHRGTLPILK